MMVGDSDFLFYLVYEIVVIIVFYKVGRHDETSDRISPTTWNQEEQSFRRHNLPGWQYFRL